MKFDMSAAWRDAVAMLGGNREVLLVVAGIFFFLPSLAIALTMPGMQEAMLADPDTAQEQVLAIYADWWWLLLIVVVTQIVGYLALLALLRDDSRPTVGDAIKTGLTGLLPAIGTYIVLSLGLGLLLGVLIGLAAVSGSAALAVIVVFLVFVTAVYVLVKVSLAGPVIAIDKVYNPITILTRSWSLTKGNSFRLFLFYLLLVIAYIVIAAVVGLVVGATVLALGESTALLVNGIVSGILGAIATVVFVAVLAAVHRQLSGPSAASVSATFE